MLSEVGMLPAELMGLNPGKFKQLNSLVKNQKFLRALIQNVQSTLHFVKNNRFNSIIINYDEKSDNLFNGTSTSCRKFRKIKRVFCQLFQQCQKTTTA